jgi:hypothetical protein
MIEDIQYRYDRRWRGPHCRSVRVCHRTRHGRLRCGYERVCRR